MTYGIGVIGVGVWGCHSLEQTLASTGNANIIAVSADPSLGANCHGTELTKKAKNYAKEHNAQFYSNWYDVINNPDVKIISAMVSPKQKAEIITESLKAGKHVVTDKPLAISKAEAEKICQVEQQSTAQGFMLAGYHTRPMVQHLIDEINKDRLGEIKAVSIRLCFMGGIFPGFIPSPEWRSDIPSAELTTIGSHALVTLFKILPTPIAHVHALLKNNFYDSYKQVNAEDWAHLNLKHQNGAISTIVTGRIPHRIPKEDIAIEITGTSGYAQLTNNRLTYYPDEEIIELPIDGQEILNQTFRDYYQAIQTQNAPPTTFQDGLYLQTILDAAIQSSQTNQVISLDK